MLHAWDFTFKVAFIVDSISIIAQWKKLRSFPVMSSWHFWEKQLIFDTCDWFALDNECITVHWCCGLWLVSCCWNQFDWLVRWRHQSGTIGGDKASARLIPSIFIWFWLIWYSTRYDLVFSLKRCFEENWLRTYHRFIFKMNGSMLEMKIDE